MKKLIVILLVLLSIDLSAQIKVKTNGKAIIGQDRVGDDTENVLSATIFGPLGDYRYGGKLAFGDFSTATNYGWNVFIGEYGTYDSDILWLHGKSGIYLSGNGDGSDIGMKVWGNHTDINGNLYTYGDVYSWGTKLISDKRLKSNIKGIDNALSKICKLEGLSYDLLPQNYPYNDGCRSKIENDIKPSKNTKGGKGSAFEALQKNKFKKERLGFVAQDLQEVFPDLVSEDTAGYLSIDYIGLIPVIVEALKEQQSIIDAQSLKIKELEEKIDDPSNKDKLKSAEASAGMSDPLTTNAFLYQNTPNPFTYNTEIRYFIPNEVTNAVLYIFNLQGQMIKSEKIATSGQGSITVNGSELYAGMYVYSLIIDGQEVDTKRMILTE